MANRGNSNKARRREAAYARQRDAHDSAAIRHAKEREREAAQRHAADALLDLEARWGTRADALKRIHQEGFTDPPVNSGSSRTPHFLKRR